MADKVRLATVSPPSLFPTFTSTKLPNTITAGIIYCATLALAALFQVVFLKPVPLPPRESGLANFPSLFVHLLRYLPASACLLPFYLSPSFNVLNQRSVSIFYCLSLSVVQYLSL